MPGTRLTEKEILFIKDNIENMSAAEMRETLGRSGGAISRAKKSLGIVKGNNWCSEDDSVIANGRRKTNKELAAELRRTPDAIQYRRNLLGLPMLNTCPLCSKDFVKSRRSITCEECRPHSTYHRNPGPKYTQYKQNARVKNIEFSLTLQEFLVYWQEPCNYCGSKNDTIGVDRIDSSIGYITSNVTACCPTCNTMKMASPVEDWYAHMYKILKHQNKLT